MPAFFLDRPNRFLVDAVLEDGRRVRAHLADPGRLRELLLPGAPLRLRPADAGATRATRYTVALVRAATAPHAWVSVDTTLANRLAERLLRAGRVRGVGVPGVLRREVRRGTSRFDFVVERPAGEAVVEVKSVTLVERGIARFPDAPTKRGTRHVRELEARARAGRRAVVLFVVARSDARAVVPHRRLDPDFAQAVRDARGAGVLLRAARFALAGDGRAAHLGPLPVRC